MSRLMFSSIFAGIVVIVLCCDLCLSEELKGEESSTGTSIMAWEGKRSLPTDVSEMARNLDAIREAFVEKIDSSTSEIREILEKSKSSLSSKGRMETWYSKDPNDLKPLAGSTLDFFYYLSGNDREQVIIFDTEIHTLDNGEVLVVCVDHYETGGIVQYTDSLLGGYGYTVVLVGETAHPFFGKIVNTLIEFKICHSRDECNIIIGMVIFQDSNTQELIAAANLDTTSTCVDGCTNAYCNGDVDGDGRIGLQEAIKALKVTSGTP